jgi:MFS family permease
MSTETATEVPSHPPLAPVGKGLLINRNFALLSIGQAISNIGDFVYSTTLLVWVYTLTHSAAAVSGVLIAQYAPIFLLGPVAGVYVDRWNRRQTMIVSDIAQTIAAVLPLLAPLAFRLPTIYASVFLLSACSRFFIPARAGVQQVIVAPEQQGQAASVGQVTLAMSIIIGPAIATPLFFIVGPIIAVAINAASFLVSAICIQVMRVSKVALQPRMLSGKDDTKPGVSAVMKELSAGFRFVGKTRVLLVVVILVLIAMIGAVCAGIIVRKLKPKYLLVGSILLLGAGIIVYSFQTWYFAALVINFILSILR